MPEHQAHTPSTSGDTGPAPRGPDCLDPSCIDHLAAGDEPGDAQRAHLASCPTCRAALALAAADTRLLTRLRVAVAEHAVRHAGNTDLPDDLIPGYRLVEEISRGSQGVVYKAIQERTKRTVAVKMLLGGAFATDRQRARFEREIEVVAALKHPGIVTIYDSTPVRGRRYAYVMEFIEGVPLDDWEPPGDTPALRRLSLLRLFAALCEIVQYAHNNGVIHRDLKPGNILVDSSLRPRILDFGIASLSPLGAPGLAALTAPGEFTGTLAFASPEQVAPHAAGVDARSDVYALGVMLYARVCGAHPYPVDGSLASLIDNICNRHPAEPRRLDPSISRDLSAVLLHALHKDPARRYQSPRALGEDLARCIRSEPVSVERESLSYFVRTFLHRHRGQALAAGLAAAGLVTVAGVVRTSRQREHAAQQRSLAAAELSNKEAARVRGTSLLLRETLPPPRVADDDLSARHAANGLSRMKGRIELGYLADEPVAQSAALSMLGAAFHARGSLALAETGLRQAMVSASATDGLDSPAVATAMVELADVILERKRPIEAEWYARRALAIQERTLGADSVAARRTRELLARVLIARLEPAAALAICDELEPAMPLSPPSPADDLLHARVLDTRAVALTALGRAAEARAAARAALVARLSHLPYDDPELNASLARLADTIEAAADLGRCTDIALALGRQSPNDLADFLRQMASTLGARYSPEAANAEPSDTAPMLAHLIELDRTLLGSNSPATGRALAELGWRLRNARDYAAAEPVLGEAITIFRVHFDATSPVLANCLEVDASVLGALSRPSDAADAALEAFRIWRAQPGYPIESMGAWAVARDAACHLHRARRHQEVADLCDELIPEMESRLGPQHYAVARMKSIHGAALCHLSETPQAEELTREALRVLSTDPATPPDQLHYAELCLAGVLASRGEIDEAEPILLRAWDSLYPDFTPGHPVAAEIASILEGIYTTRNNAAAAIHWHSAITHPSPAPTPGPTKPK